MKASIGCIGLGMMGSAIAHRLLEHGYDVTVWSRTAEKCEPLRDAGAAVAESPEDIAVSHSIILTMLSTSDVVDTIASRIRQHAAAGTVHVDMSTVSPVTTQACEKAARESGSVFLHAPVLGSVPQVVEGKLLIFAGGDDTALSRVEPVLSVLGQKMYRFAHATDASHMKLTCNFFIASMILTLGQGLQFATAAGIDGALLLDVLSRSALSAPMYQSKGKSILAGVFEPRFMLEHMLKDVRLFRSAAADLGLNPECADALVETFKRASDLGYGDRDYSAVVHVLQEHTEKRFSPSP